MSIRSVQTWRFTSRPPGKWPNLITDPLKVKEGGREREGEREIEGEREREVERGRERERGRGIEGRNGGGKD